MKAHPYQALPAVDQKRLFWIALVASVLLMGILNGVGAAMITPAAPLGVISFEFSGNSVQAGIILDSWDFDAQLRAAFSLGLDFLFMAAYATAIGLADLRSGRVLTQVSWPLAKLGSWFAWALWLAALLDVVENIALTQILFGRVIFPWPEIAFWCALFKFAIVAAGLLYALYGLSAYLFRRLS